MNTRGEKWAALVCGRVANEYATAARLNEAGKACHSVYEFYALTRAEAGWRAALCGQALAYLVAVFGLSHHARMCSGVKLILLT